MTQAAPSGRKPCTPCRSSRLSKPAGCACQSVRIILPIVESKPAKSLRRCNMTRGPLYEHDRCLGKVRSRSQSPRSWCISCRSGARQVRQATRLHKEREAANERHMSCWNKKPAPGKRGRRAARDEGVDGLVRGGCLWLSHFG